MSRLYNYFLNCWVYNEKFTKTNLDNAVTKRYITTEEKTQIEASERDI